ncbi:hypothetical protein SAMN02745136_00838 [Anaerocolumna jejuensis DSM 15929]|uniref:Uncharacterized protein n=1 Tax=Anaerocolumna jejuensis DSM 15929 TaxID=1121322 RepID=A0A1M6M485_9FIRM|nr:hypothetical protein SAMN02745136_00838 [Anaerocolumna jejuensis DSM 15929]
MNTNLFKTIMKALCFTFLAVLISYFVIGKLLVYAFNFSTVEASYHLTTYTLLIGLIFIIIFCTILILDKIDSITKKD